MILIIGLATICSTLIGGFLAIRFHDRLHLILGFSAGAVLGVALFDLLPESIALGTQNYSVSLVTLLIALGFVAYMILDRLFSISACKKGVCEKPAHHGPLAAGSLAFHSFLDGLGIGLAFKVSPAVGTVVTAAVLAHDFSDGINTINVIFVGQGNKKQAIRWLIIDAIAPMLGIIVSLFLVLPESTLGLFLAIFTGLFLYIGASELIPESHHRHPSSWTTISTILGIALIYIVIHFAG
jgi:ZIP family zinc transporter